MCAIGYLGGLDRPSGWGTAVVVSGQRVVVRGSLLAMAGPFSMTRPFAVAELLSMARLFSMTGLLSVTRLLSMTGPLFVVGGSDRGMALTDGAW